MKTIFYSTLLGLVVLFSTACRDEPEVKTYKLVYPEERPERATQAREPHVHDAQDMGQLPDGHPPIGGMAGGTDMGALPDGHPPVGSMAAAPPVGGAPQHVPYLWEIPERWSAKGIGSMRLASYDVPAPAGDYSGPADFSIVRLGGAAGGLAGNINRWRQQINLAIISEAEILASMVSVPTGLGPEAKIVEMHNDEAGQSILAAIIEEKEGLLFVKLQGPSATAKGASEEFQQVVRSIRDDGHNH